MGGPVDEIDSSYFFLQHWMPNTAPVVAGLLASSFYELSPLFLRLLDLSINNRKRERGRKSVRISSHSTVCQTAPRLGRVAHQFFLRDLFLFKGVGLGNKHP